MGLTTLIIFALFLAACSPAVITTPAAPAPTATTAGLPNTAATSAPQASLLKLKSQPILGNILASSSGMTLYIFMKDTPGTSNCYDKCATNWPPLTVSAGASLNGGNGISAKLGTTQRKDGTMQLTVNNMPVYFFGKDKSAGDANGQGVGGIWWVLDGSGNIVKTLPPITPAAPAATSTPAANAAIIKVANNSTLGKILTDSKGMTLYVFTVDTPNTSNCNDKCATNWPPLTIQSGMSLTAGPGITAKLGTTTRKDGSMQLTVNGMPVYTFFKDSKPGDTNGQGVGSVWFTLNDAGEIVKTTTAPTAAPASSSSYGNAGGYGNNQ